MVAGKNESMGPNVGGRPASHSLTCVVFKCFPVCKTIHAINWKLSFIATQGSSATEKCLREAPIRFIITSGKQHVI